MPTMEFKIAERLGQFDSSGIRKMFELAAQLRDPINLSIGEPDFEVPPAVKQRLIDAIQAGKNGYAPPQGIPPLREELQHRIDQQFGHSDRKVMVTSGTSGGLTLLMLALINPGDEVIIFDPYFVLYRCLIGMAGGIAKPISTYPDFQVDPDRVAAAISDRTKMIIVNSPGNPTGVVWDEARLRDVSQLAERRGICLVSDEIYSDFVYDQPHRSCATFNPDAVVVNGFSKSHAMTGLRLGYAHGPSPIIDAMIQLQQFTFVCAPQPCQWAGLTALQTDVSAHVAEYRRKRDTVVQGLQGHFELIAPRGAFFAFPKAPWGTGEEFAHRALEKNVLVIPGKVFSRQDTHFRISMAVSDAKLEAGVRALVEVADAGPA